jgi:hypothetical protein
MQIEVAVKKVEYRKVSVNPYALLQQMEKEWIRTVHRKADYMEDGSWVEYEEHYHGSGSTNILRAATEEEKQIMAAFTLLKQVHKT